MQMGVSGQGTASEELLAPAVVPSMSLPAQPATKRRRTSPRDSRMADAEDAEEASSADPPSETKHS